MKTNSKLLIIAFFLFPLLVFSQYYEEANNIYSKYETIISTLNRKKEFEIKSLSSNNYIQNKKDIQNKYSKLIENAYAERNRKIEALKVKYDKINQKQNEIEQKKYQEENILRQKKEEEEIFTQNMVRVKEYINIGDEYIEKSQFESALDYYISAENILSEINQKSENLSERIVITKEKINEVKKIREEEIKTKTKETLQFYITQANIEYQNKNYSECLKLLSNAQELEYSENIRKRILEIEKERDLYLEQKKIELEKKEKKEKTLKTILGIGSTILINTVK